ncbi:hypothetical protein [Ruminococcus sp.]|jgi:hypothetical protein|uniref:hypothetical protein n=1 Tax=Ruminococcus sp. TaxID=41978 RepID=UPI0025DE7C63|nr:hypothetical protein [Ruminococcus sp.]
MKKFLTMIIMTVLTIGVLIPFKANAADVDSVLNDPVWNDYVEQSMASMKQAGTAFTMIRNSP